MARLLTWNDVFEYAVEVAGLSEETLRSSFHQTLTQMKKTCPMKKSGLSEREIHLNAEIQWWNSLCLGIQFPRADIELENQASIVDDNEHFPVKTPSPSETEKRTRGYASSYTAILKKGLSMGYTADYIISVYRSNLDVSMDKYLKDSGHAAAQFNGEVGWWRDLFPNEPFTGIDPLTGVPNLQTGNDLLTPQQKAKSRKRKDKTPAEISILWEAARIKRDLVKRRAIRSVPRQQSKTLSPSPPPKPAPAKQKLKLRLRLPLKSKPKLKPQLQPTNQPKNQSQLQHVHDSSLSSHKEDANYHLSDTELLRFPSPPPRPTNNKPPAPSPTPTPEPTPYPTPPHPTPPNSIDRSRTLPPELSHGTDKITTGMKQKRTRSLDARSSEDGVNGNVESIMRNLKKIRRGDGVAVAVAAVRVMEEERVSGSGVGVMFCQGRFDI